jgi:hypothetical protein
MRWQRCITGVVLRCWGAGVGRAAAAGNGGAVWADDTGVAVCNAAGPLLDWMNTRCAGDTAADNVKLRLLYTHSVTRA